MLVSTSPFWDASLLLGIIAAIHFKGETQTAGKVESEQHVTTPWLFAKSS